MNLEILRSILLELGFLAGTVSVLTLRTCKTQVGIPPMTAVLKSGRLLSKSCIEFTSELSWRFSYGSNVDWNCQAS